MHLAQIGTLISLKFTILKFFFEIPCSKNAPKLTAQNVGRMHRCNHLAPNLSRNASETPWDLQLQESTDQSQIRQKAKALNRIERPEFYFEGTKRCSQSTF